MCARPLSDPMIVQRTRPPGHSSLANTSEVRLRQAPKPVILYWLCIKREGYMRDRTKRRTLVTACAILFAIGLVSSMVGPVLPDLARITGSDLASLGAIFTLLFLGSVVSQSVAGFMTDRIGHRPVL